MNVLVLGQGGREHAIAWKLAANAKKVYLHPGNAGTLSEGIPNFGEAPQDADYLAACATEHSIDLVVIGPETLLAQGYADTFRRRGFAVVGPNAQAARLESSKIFAKRFMARAGIPTADFRVFTSLSQLEAFKPERFPYVLKFDGLAAGKGVVVAANQAELLDFARRVWKDREFGDSDSRVLGEVCLSGREVSFIGLCDGNRFVPLASATDYKRVGDGDTGPNTGGMGCLSPSPYFDSALEEKIHARVIQPLLRQLKADGLDYRGALYVGVMVSPSGDPYVLEFNARFGDPETQAILLRLESDFVHALTLTARGELSSLEQLRWSRNSSVYVVGAAEGYPGKPKTGDVITGVEVAGRMAKVFYSGVEKRRDNLVTAGGRVLGVGALGPDLARARAAAYEALSQLSWRGGHHRSDIGSIK